jgi:hypothetical protein
LSFIAKKIKFRKFRSNNICLGKTRVLSKEKAGSSKISGQYDIFIAGSDQVWNVKNTNNDYFYFLDFVNESVKKKSYAASFGFDEIPKEYVADYKKHLSSFSDISVRESQGALIIEKLLNIKVPVLLDPTLLLDKNEWTKLCKNRVKINNYILVFGVYFSSEIDCFVKELKRKTGCNVVVINDNVLDNLRSVRVCGIGPYEFIELFVKASYVVTNSYHGTAFSINFRKNFFVALQQSYAENTNSRINNLLDIFNLKDRIISGDSEQNCLAPVNYDNIDSKFDEERKHALNYLKNITIRK